MDKRIPDDFANTETPKYKFNFLLKFKFRSAPPNTQGTLDINTNTFAVRQMGRPNPVIQYQDVNYYGFRTKVATRTDFSVFNVSFYDDGPGRAHDLFETYMESISSLVKVPNANALAGKQTVIELPDSDFLGPIEHIELIHYHQMKHTRYRFQNPKVTNFLLDELDMTQSEVSTVTLSFVYDSFYIVDSPRGGGTTNAFDAGRNAANEEVNLDEVVDIVSPEPDISDFEPNFGTGRGIYA